MTEWNPYEEALQGKPVFFHRYDVATDKFHIYQDHRVTVQAEHSIIHGTQYSSEERSRRFSAALLWRTIRDTDTVQGALGSILCLSEPNHATARTLLSQAFQGPLTASERV